MKPHYKSPLRYPGGKQRAIKHILPHLPHFGTYLSPFLGGASVELALLERGSKVIGCDAFEPLVNFWELTKVYRVYILGHIRTYYTLIRDGLTLYRVREVVNSKDHYKAIRAAAYFVVNRSSFSGATLSGGFHKDPLNTRFTLSSIERLEALGSLDNLAVRCLDFSESLNEYPDLPAYLDPPYYLENGSRLYGNRGDIHKDFDHQNLAELLRDRSSFWLMSYNDCPQIRKLYEGFYFKELSWAYGMNKTRKSSEILISNQSFD